MAILIGVDFAVGLGMNYLQNKAFQKSPHNLGMKTLCMIQKTTDDILIVGASEATHHYISKLIEDSTNLSTYNFGQDGRFFLYQNCLVNLTLKRYSPRVIIWQFEESYLTTSLDAMYEYRGISGLYSYYKDDYCKQVIDGSSKFQKYKMLSKMFKFNSKICGILYSLLITESYEKGYVPLKSQEYQYIEMNDKLDTCGINANKVERLQETIKYCKEHNVLLVISLGPNFYIKQQYETPQYKLLLSIAEKNDVPIIESRKYREHFEDASLFKDTKHMNDVGAKLWMTYFIPELEQIMKENGVIDKSNE